MSLTPAIAGTCPNTDSSKLSTPSTTPISTPSLRPQDSDANVPKLNSNALPADLRDYPKPSDEVDVKAMLERHPGRWTIQGQIEANEHRPKRVINPEELAAERKRGLDAAKKDLLALANSGNWR